MWLSTCHVCIRKLNKDLNLETLRGRPFDILGGGGGGGMGGWVIFPKKFLSLVLQEKNNLFLKKIGKNNLSLKSTYVNATS